MSIATPQTDADVRPPAGEPGGRPPRQSHRVVAVVVGLTLAAATAVGIVRPFGQGRADGDGAEAAAATSLATVTRRSLAARTSMNGVLGYSGSYSVVNQSTGTITALPSVGEVVEPGRVLYGVDGSPVVLLKGRTPSYRSLAQDMRGTDVRQLNANLVRLGYATEDELDPTSDRFTSRTALGLMRLQAHLGLERTGTLPIDQAVFLPTAVRITEASAVLGTPAQPGVSILSATSTHPQVGVDLDAAQQALVKVGDRVRISLPDGRSIRGLVSEVGSVASTSRESEDALPTIPVKIALVRPAKVGALDQAPVLVSIITDRVKDVLVVPIDALLALAGGEYAVEVADGASRRLITVELGLFDETEGLVQVSGSGLRESQRVVVPAS